MVERIDVSVREDALRLARRCGQRSYGQQSVETFGNLTLLQLLSAAVAASRRCVLLQSLSTADDTEYRLLVADDR